MCGGCEWVAGVGWGEEEINFKKVWFLNCALHFLSLPSINLRNIEPLSSNHDCSRRHL